MGWEMVVVVTFEPPLSPAEAQQMRTIMSDMGELERRGEQWVIKPAAAQALELTRRIARHFGSHSCTYQSRLTVN